MIRSPAGRPGIVAAQIVRLARASGSAMRRAVVSLLVSVSLPAAAEVTLSISVSQREVRPMEPVLALVTVQNHGPAPVDFTPDWVGLVGFEYSSDGGPWKNLPIWWPVPVLRTPPPPSPLAPGGAMSHERPLYGFDGGRRPFFAPGTTYELRAFLHTAKLRSNSVTLAARAPAGPDVTALEELQRDKTLAFLLLPTQLARDTNERAPDRARRFVEASPDGVYARYVRAAVVGLAGSLGAGEPSAALLRGYRERLSRESPRLLGYTDWLNNMRFSER